MIPKIIHYCWFGRGPIPAYLQECIDSWKKIMPDYEIKCWNEENFNVNSNLFCKEAYEKKKFAFVSDYVRVYSLYTEGGLYFDTDVKVVKKFDRFLDYNFVTAVEYHDDIFKQKNSLNLLDENFKRINPNIMDVQGLGLLAAIMLSTPHQPILKDVLEYYNTVPFILEDGGLNLVVSPAIYAAMCEKYGFRYKNETQIFFDKYLVLKNDIFAVKESFTNDSIAVHIGNGSWIDDVSFMNKISRFMKKYKLTNHIYKTLKRLKANI